MGEYPSLRKILPWGWSVLWLLATFSIIQDEGLTLTSSLWLLAGLLMLPPIYWRVQARLYDRGPKADA